MNGRACSKAVGVLALTSAILGAVCAYAVFGLTSLTFWNPQQLLVWAANIYNVALGFSCFHVLAVNTTLLPREIRPNWFIRVALVCGGIYFTALASISIIVLVLGK